MASLPSASTPTSPSSALSSNTILPSRSSRFPSSPLFRLPYKVRLRIYAFALTTTVLTWPRASQRQSNSLRQRQQAQDGLSPSSSPSLSPVHTPESSPSSSSSSTVLLSADDPDYAAQQQQQQQQLQLQQSHLQLQQHQQQRRHGRRQQSNGQEEESHDSGQQQQSHQQNGTGNGGADVVEDQNAIATALLRTCRAIYIEATDVLYSQNRFVFHHPSDCNMFVRIYGRGIAQSQVAKVRSPSDAAISSPSSTSANTSDPVLTPAATSTSPIAHVCFRIRDRDVGLWINYLASTFASRSLRGDLPNLQTLWIFFRSTYWTDLDGDPLDNYVRWTADPRLRDLCLSLCERKTSLTAMNGVQAGGRATAGNGDNHMPVLNAYSTAHQLPQLQYLQQAHQPNHHHHHNHNHHHHIHHYYHHHHHQPHNHPLPHPNQHHVPHPQQQQQQQHPFPDNQPHPHVQLTNYLLSQHQEHHDHHNNNSNSNNSDTATPPMPFVPDIPPVPLIPITYPSPIPPPPPPPPQAPAATSEESPVDSLPGSGPAATAKQPFSPVIRVMCLYKLPRIDIIELLRRHRSQLSLDPVQDLARSRFFRIHGIEVALELLPLDLPLSRPS